MYSKAWKTVFNHLNELSGQLVKLDKILTFFGVLQDTN